MTSPTWKEVFAVFEQASELPAEERAAFLDGACADAEIRRTVEELLRVDEEEETAAASGPPVRGAAEGKAPEREVPTRLGAYRVLRQVGQGGMSTVFLAVRADDAFNRQVVVKLVRQGMESEAFLRRLRIERQILANLDHPNIARLYDGGSTEEGLPYFVMEYIEGQPIDRYCDDDALGVDQRLTLFRKVCAAVHYAHQNLVIHRDIKPSNILVTPEGEPKLLDFGIARLLNPDLIAEEIEPTVTWQRIMTPSYASPEQLRGQPVATASDVYSLGVLLYKLLTGRLPRSYKGLSQSEIVRLLAETEPLRPSAVGLPEDTEGPSGPAPAGSPLTVPSFAKELAGDLDAIVLKALRTSPAQRYGSVEQLAADLDRFQRGLPVEARAGTWRYRAGKFVRRHRGGVAAVAAAVTLLVGFSVATFLQSEQVARERDQARLERDKKQEVLQLILDVFKFSNPYVLPGEQLTVRDALTRSVPVLEAGLREQPEVRAELLHTSGSILSVLRENDSAQRQLEEALEIRRSLLGESHRDVIETTSALAAVKKQLGELDEAEALAENSVELARQLGGDARSTLIDALNELVSVRCYRSEEEAAEAPARDALALARQLPAGEQEILALEYLAQIETVRGDYAAAAELYRRALPLRQ
ncbi:MAG: serine/threonine protein kinase, partial [Acidobacteria bacterium]|nr:serine/threonine protein kinase [Acidobacteriota bacterium]